MKLLLVFLLLCTVHNGMGHPLLKEEEEDDHKGGEIFHDSKLVQLFLPRTPLADETVKDDGLYFTIEKGKCPRTATEASCIALAIARNITLKEIANPNRQSFPHGCYHKTTTNIVYFNGGASSRECTYRRQCICRKRDVNECTLNTHNCHGNAECTNTDGSFKCKCKAGYKGDGETCTDVNECSSNTHDCHDNAVCANTDGSFTCKCKSGHEGTGKVCTDIDECQNGNHGCAQICRNREGHFECECRSGWELKADKKTCLVNGKWSSWTSYGSCSTAGKKRRTRKCNNPSPQNGGAYCFGYNTAQQMAYEDIRECENGQWGSWGNYGSCAPKTGDNRYKTRQRSCNYPAPYNGGSNCPGSSSSRSSCRPCPETYVDFNGYDLEFYKDINTWSFCSAICRGTSGCGGWTWVWRVSTYYCYLKNTNYEYGRQSTSNSNVVSGSRDCGGG